jgi:hypothetical protein
MMEDPWRSDVVSGLPLNFYNPAWLNSLSPMARAAVNPTDPINLGIPEDVAK